MGDLTKIDNDIIEEVVKTRIDLKKLRQQLREIKDTIESIKLEPDMIANADKEIRLAIFKEEKDYLISTIAVYEGVK